MRLNLLLTYIYNTNKSLLLANLDNLVDDPLKTLSQALLVDSTAFLDADATPLLIVSAEGKGVTQLCIAKGVREVLLVRQD
jgi:hypothetical protein